MILKFILFQNLFTIKTFLCSCHTLQTKQPDTDVSYKIRQTPYSFCTIHLAWDEPEHPKTLEIRDRVIRDNKDSALFTILNTKYRKKFQDEYAIIIYYVTRSIEVFEECSIQLLIESPETTKDDTDASLWVFQVSRYPQSLEGRNNILIIVRFTLFEPREEKAKNLPFEIFIHFINLTRNPSA